MGTPMTPVDRVSMLRDGSWSVFSASAAMAVATRIPSAPVQALAYLAFITTPRRRPGRSLRRAWL